MRISDWSSDVCSSDLDSPKVVWVRSLVPKLKNSATLAIRPACSAARGSSIMVPTMYSTAIPVAACTSPATRSMIAFRIEISLSVRQRDHHLGHRCGTGRLRRLGRRLEDRAGLHLADLREGRSEERRVGQKWGSTCRSRVSPNT